MRILDDSRVVAATLTGSEQAGIQVGDFRGETHQEGRARARRQRSLHCDAERRSGCGVATAVDARVQNNGQSCIAAKRFIVAEGSRTQFERKFVKRCRRCAVGDPFDEKTQLGPLATRMPLPPGCRCQEDGSCRGARLDRRPSVGAPRELLCAYGPDGHSEGFARVSARNSLGRWLRSFA